MMIYATDEDQRMIEDFIFLPLAKKVLDRDRKIIEKSPFKFPGLYIKIVEMTSFKLSEQMREARKYILDHNIKVIKKDALNYEVIVRGYREKVEYFYPSIAEEKVEQILEKALQIT